MNDTPLGMTGMFQATAPLTSNAFEVRGAVAWNMPVIPSGVSFIGSGVVDVPSASWKFGAARVASLPRL